MISAPLVSVLMNCYNSEKYLEETLASLFKQTYSNWQLIFVDNCSVDNSKKILDRYSPDSRIVYLLTPHHMPLGEAREFGLQSCSGDFICYLDTDDIWTSTKLEKQIKILQNNPELLLCYSSYYIIDEKSQVTGQQKLKSKRGKLFGYNLARYEVNFQTVMIRREALNEINLPYFDPVLKFAPDHNLVMRLLACCFAVCLEDKLVYYRRSAGSLTQKSIDLWGIELEYTYNQLNKSNLLLPNSTIEQRNYALANIAHNKAVYLMSENNWKMARQLLQEYKTVSIKYFLLYQASRVPFLWHGLRKIKRDLQI